MLKIGAGVDLPDDAITRTFGIFGQRGTGKTNTAVVIVEEIVRIGGHVVIFDPVGAWWGVTHAGSGRGLPGIVIGGRHADVPLEETAGRLVADLLVDRHWQVVVVDTRLMRKAARLRFMADCLEDLYHRNELPLHVVFEEADKTLPQSPRGMDPTLGRVLGAAEDIVKLGRLDGLGATVVSQRFATVNANVREQIEALFLHTLAGPLDRRAAKGWIEANGDAELTATILNALPSFDVGQAQLYSPAWLRRLETVRMRHRRTFDSSATPKDGGARKATPTKRAPVDLDELHRMMAETVERARANDPRLLRARVAELERKLEQAEAEQVPFEVEVPMLAAGDVAALQEAATALRATREDLIDGASELRQQMARLGREFDARVEEVEDLAERIETAVEQATGMRVGRVQAPRGALADLVQGAKPSISPTPVARAPRAAAAPAGERDGLTGPQARVLDAIMWLAEVGFDRPSKLQVGFIAGYRVGKRVGGTFGNVLGQLRSAELIDYPAQGVVVLSPAGSAVAQRPDIERTTEGLQAAVFERLNGPEQRVLAGIIAEYPAALTKQDAGARAGYTVGDRVGGTFGNVLGRLRSLGLIDYPQQGTVVATDVLFLNGARPVR